MVYLKYSKKHRDKIQKLPEKFRKMTFICPYMEISYISLHQKQVKHKIILI